MEAIHAGAYPAINPGGRGCHCHLAYGFKTAEDMQEADELRLDPAQYYEVRESE